jgi:hypothetical protein
MHSKSNEFGSAVFLTTDGAPHCTLNISDSLFVNNTEVRSSSTASGQTWNWCDGVSTDNQHNTEKPGSSPEPVNTTFCDAVTGCTKACTTAASDQ